MKLPDNRLNIIVPILSEKVLLKQCDTVYPQEFTGIDVTMGRHGNRGYIELYPITSDCPRRAKNATETIAYYFKREFGLDFPGYETNGTQDRRDRIFLLAESETDYGDDERSVIGAIAFRWRNYTDPSLQRVLSWIWIHPFRRRIGIGTHYWGIFRNIYGDFHVEYPYSKAMHAFLAKMNALSSEDKQDEDPIFIDE